MSSPRRGQGAWPALLTFALLFGGAITWGVLQGRYGSPDPAPEAQTPPEAQPDLAGWRSTAALALQGMSLRLTPLHADPEHQAFDAASLAARLGLDPSGQPWRLEVDFLPLEGPDTDRTDWQALRAAIAADALRLEDNAGTCALSLAAGATPAPGAGPVLALFDPARTFAPDRSAGQVHLWGRAPGADLHLVAGDLELALVPDDFGREEVPTYVARRDPEPAR